MYYARVVTTNDETHELHADSLSEAVSFASQTAKSGDHVHIFYVLDGLCGPEVQETVLEYIEDGWKGYDEPS